jgi:hypothetical protein
MKPLIAINLWSWITEHRRNVEPPLDNHVVWEDSHFTATIADRPHISLAIACTLSVSGLWSSAPAER